MKITCNIDLDSLEPNDHFEIANTDGDTLECEYPDGDNIIGIKMDTFIDGDIDHLSEEVASMSRSAAFIEQLRDHLRSLDQGILTDMEAVDGAHEDPYLILYMNVDIMKGMVE